MKAVIPGVVLSAPTGFLDLLAGPGRIVPCPEMPPPIERFVATVAALGLAVFVLWFRS